MAEEVKKDDSKKKGPLGKLKEGLEDTIDYYKMYTKKEKIKEKI